MADLAIIYAGLRSVQRNDTVFQKTVAINDSTCRRPGREDLLGTIQLQATYASWPRSFGALSLPGAYLLAAYDALVARGWTGRRCPRNC